MADNSGMTDSSGKPVKSILKKGQKKHTKPVFVVSEEKQEQSWVSIIHYYVWVFKWLFEDNLSK